VGSVVVTGASGFIGGHVAQFLAAEGFDVVPSDIRPPPRPTASWREADLTRPEDLAALTRGAEAVCHIGGIGDVYVATKDPALAMHVNGCATSYLLEAARTNGVRRIVYASSWEVYGPPRYQPIDENHPTAATHPYNISKLAGDLLVQSAGRHGPMRTVALRLGTAYGPGIRENAVIPLFVRKALNREPIEIQGTGTQYRQFTHVTDIARAFALALRSPDPGPVYNVVSPEQTTIRGLAEAIVGHLPTSIVYREGRTGDPPPAIIDASRIRKELGWEAKVALSDGLASFVKDYEPKMTP
jgi:UDP-glucose 4-epimerase